jgi:hypothetical protein
MRLVSSCIAVSRTDVKLVLGVDEVRTLPCPNEEPIMESGDLDVDLGSSGVWCDLAVGGRRPYSVRGERSAWGRNSDPLSSLGSGAHVEKANRQRDACRQRRTHQPVIDLASHSGPARCSSVDARTLFTPPTAHHLVSLNTASSTSAFDVPTSSKSSATFNTSVFKPSPATLSA